MKLPGYAVKKIDDMEAIYGGAFKRARAELGVDLLRTGRCSTSRRNADQYPEHDHAEDGQEEVYVILRGSGEVEIDGERPSAGTDTMVRVTLRHEAQDLAGRGRGHASAGDRRRPRQAVRGAGVSQSSELPDPLAQAQS